MVKKYEPLRARMCAHDFLNACTPNGRIEVVVAVPFVSLASDSWFYDWVSELIVPECGLEGEAFYADLPVIDMKVSPVGADEEKDEVHVRVNADARNVIAALKGVAP